MRLSLLLISCSIFIISCSRQSDIPESKTKSSDSLSTVTIKKDSINPIEAFFISQGLIDVQTIDSTIQVKLIYADTNNFMKKNLYGQLKKCYLQKEAAINLSKAQKALQHLFPGFSLLITDGARPFHVQQYMWDSVKISVEERYKFLSSPNNGSVHNYGAAVDVTILDAEGDKLDMGTPIDYFSELSYPMLEEQFLKQGKLTQTQINNRKLLRNVMKSGGYINIPTEWWHFNAWLRRVVIKQFAMLDMTKTAPLQQTAEAGSIVFKVQIMMVSNPIGNVKAIFGALPIEQYIHDTKYKYTTGTCADLASAYKLREKIIKTTRFKDCFVIAFNGTERIGVQEAIDLMQ